MPNHFHLVLRPHDDGDLSTWMQWLLTTHVRRYHKHHHTVGGGHVWQGRFKAFPIELDEHLLAVLRYVERNPKRANLVEAAQDWRWSSVRWRSARPPEPPLPWLAELPIDLPANWTRRVNQPESEPELEAIRRSIWGRGMDRASGGAAGLGINAAAAREAEKDEERVETGKRREQMEVVQPVARSARETRWEPKGLAGADA